MESYCKNCKGKILEDENKTTKNKINSLFCNNCQVTILSFMEFINKKSNSALKALEANKDRLILKGITDDGLKYLYKYCVYIDEKRQKVTKDIISPESQKENRPDVKAEQMVSAIKMHNEVIIDKSIEILNKNKESDANITETDNQTKITDKTKKGFQNKNAVKIVNKANKNASHKKSIKYITIIFLTCIVITATIALAYFFVILPNNIYNNIISYIDSRDYIKAQEQLNKISNIGILDKLYTNIDNYVYTTVNTMILKNEYDKIPDLILFTKGAVYLDRVDIYTHESNLEMAYDSILSIINNAINEGNYAFAMEIISKAKIPIESETIRPIYTNYVNDTTDIINNASTLMDVYNNDLSDFASYMTSQTSTFTVEWSKPLEMIKAESTFTKNFINYSKKYPAEYINNKCRELNDCVSDIYISVLFVTSDYPDNLLRSLINKDSTITSKLDYIKLITENAVFAARNLKSNLYIDGYFE